MQAPPRMCAVVGMPPSVSVTSVIGLPSSFSATRLRQLVRLGDVGGGLRAALQLRQDALAEAGAEAASAAEGEVALERAHVEQDHRGLRPVAPRSTRAPCRSGWRAISTSRRHRRDTNVEPDTCGAPIRRKKPEPSRVAHRLEVRVLVGLQDGADGDALREVQVAPPRGDADERLGVGAHEAPEPGPTARAAPAGRASARSSSGTVPSTPPANTTLSAVKRTA